MDFQPTLVEVQVERGGVEFCVILWVGPARNLGSVLSVGNNMMRRHF